MVYIAGYLHFTVGWLETGYLSSNIATDPFNPI